MSSIESQLQSFKNGLQESRSSLKKYNDLNLFDKSKEAIKLLLADAEQYRVNIIKNISVFKELSYEGIATAAKSMDEVHYKKGDLIIEQDTMGETFFVLQAGFVEVTRKMNMKDATEKPKVLAVLGKGSYFGEISLLTTELRSASVMVTSTAAKCLKMTKSRFDALLATTNTIQSENRKLIGLDVISNVKIFEPFNSSQRGQLLKSMNTLNYSPNTYICRQGAVGNNFYIITEGTCRVTINNADKTETQVKTLRAGDYFGDVAMIEPTCRRNANVTAVDFVHCLCLSRSDFDKLLNHLKVKIEDKPGKREGTPCLVKVPTRSILASNMKMAHSSQLAKKRRISAFDVHGHKDDTRTMSLLRRYGRFTTESLWNSLYSRMYRELLLNIGKITDYGKISNAVMKCESRFDAVEAIRKQVKKILSMDMLERSDAEHQFVYGLMNQRNVLKDKICKNWTPTQFFKLCKKLKMVEANLHQTIIDSKALPPSCAFLIIRGAVRVFSQTQNSKRPYYEEDLSPGDVFCETALSGRIDMRMITVQALTDVELAVIEGSIFMQSQEQSSFPLSIEDRAKFLAAVPFFHNWDNYKLLRIASSLVQTECNKGTVLTKAGETSRSLFFVLHGRVNVLSDMNRKHIISSLLQYDLFGVTGLINKYSHSGPDSNRVEAFTSVAATKVDVLMIQAGDYNVFDQAGVKAFKTSFDQTCQFRSDRLRLSKLERASVRQLARASKMSFDNMLKRTADDVKERERRELNEPLVLVNSDDVSPVKKLGFSTNHEVEEHLQSLVESNKVDVIPDIMKAGSDPFMILGAISNENVVKSIRTDMKDSRKPPSERTKRPGSAVREREPGYTRKLCEHRAQVLKTSGTTCTFDDEHQFIPEYKVTQESAAGPTTENEETTTMGDEKVDQPSASNMHMLRDMLSSMKVGSKDVGDGQWESDETGNQNTDPVERRPRSAAADRTLRPSLGEYPDDSRPRSPPAVKLPHPSRRSFDHAGEGGVFRNNSNYNGANSSGYISGRGDSRAIRPSTAPTSRESQRRGPWGHQNDNYYNDNKSNNNDNNNNYNDNNNNNNCETETNSKYNYQLHYNQMSKLEPKFTVEKMTQNAPRTTYVPPPSRVAFSGSMRLSSPKSYMETYQSLEMKLAASPSKMVSQQQLPRTTRSSVTLRPASATATISKVNIAERKKARHRPSTADGNRKVHR